MIRSIYYLFLIIIFTPSITLCITREQVWGNGIPYFLGWSPLVDTAWILNANGDTIYPRFESYFKKGTWNIGEAYCWGGVDGPNTFLNRINAGTCAGGYNTSQYGYYIPGVPGSGSAAAHWLAGIDCAAFVNRCLQLTPGQGIVQLENSCLKIDKRKAQKGDVLTKDGLHPHARLIIETNYPEAFVFESISQPGIPPKVRGADVSMVGYEAYSIFPQFANEKPGNGSEVYEAKPEISVEVTGSGTIDISYMLLDGNPVSIACQQIQNGVKAIHIPASPLTSGCSHNVEIKATNNKVNIYEDIYTWSFTVHGECPVVVSTDPSDGAEEVDVYKKITVTFNKPMDRTTTESAIEIKNKDKNSAVTIKKIDWQDDDKTVCITAYDPVVVDDTTGLQYNTNYQVKILATAKDTSGVTLDAKLEMQYRSACRNCSIACRLV